MNVMDEYFFTEIMTAVFCVLPLLCFSASGTDFQSPQWRVTGEFVTDQLLYIWEDNKILEIPADAFAGFSSLQVNIPNI